jgi:RsiW-degrading membrane proteinase PrsW (M82 family)
MLDYLVTTIYCILPSFLYLAFAYITTPYKSWKFKRAINYMFLGSLSVLIVLQFLSFVPIWNIGYSFFTNVTSQLLYLSFVQIGLLEESSKFLIFYISRNFILKKENHDHPLSIMMYMGAISLGFAYLENIKYVFDYGSEVILPRAVSSVLLHMICGLIMGYWLSLYHYKFKIKTNPTDDISGTSIFDVIVSKNVKIRRFIYVIVGILSATFIHGLYDYNLISTRNFSGDQIIINISNITMIIILSLSLLIVKKMINHLIKINKYGIKN